MENGANTNDLRLNINMILVYQLFFVYKKCKSSQKLVKMARIPPKPRQNFIKYLYMLFSNIIAMKGFFSARYFRLSWCKPWCQPCGI